MRDANCQQQQDAPEIGQLESPATRFGTSQLHGKTEPEQEGKQRVELALREGQLEDFDAIVERVKAFPIDIEPGRRIHEGVDIDEHDAEQGEAPQHVQCLQSFGGFDRLHQCRCAC